MRKTVIITLVLCVVASFAYAQTATTGTTTSTTATTGSATGTGTTTTTTTTTKKHAATHKFAKGSIASVDATAKSFVVHPAKGADVTLKVNDKTTYAPKGKTWADVAQGADVSASYHNDGTDNWAIKVSFKAATAAAPAKTGGK
jgi:hypothetical protein